MTYSLDPNDHPPIINQAALKEDSMTEDVKEPIKIEDVMSFNIGESNYANKKIQPWHIWEEYNLNPWDADIVKRVLRTKKQVGKSLVKSRIEDYQKIIHDCQYRIKKLEESNTLDKKRR